ILLGLFENPYADPKREKEVMLAKPHQELALQMARESIVLLKNAGNLLPLGRPKTIAVIGPLANARADLLGTWCCEGDSNQVVTVLEGIRRTLGSQTRILTASGCDLDGTNGRNVPAAVALAQQADVIIAVIGESASMSGEASSRSSLNLPGLQEGLIKALAATQKPVVAVILAGRPLTIPWLAENVPAMVMAWHGGTQAGQAIADVLFGAYNPSGRLPISWPRSASQLPLYYNHKNTGRPAADSKYTSRYIDLPSGSQYPFGFGLSYSRFEYANLKLDTAEIGPAGFLQVSAEVKNSGSREGEEVVQLYIHDLVGSLTRPVRELKGFQRIHLLPGQSRNVHFTLGPDELGFYDAENRFLVEPGRFQLWIGPNCTEGLQGEFTVR
ncbi:MAG TPA: glycoside hydrolase family 3 C-terminal domain-containing protein, partial [bacterium]|nr:glycoside hydrolase family 3 C-terminal domain-containing protein [bacterium]